MKIEVKNIEIRILRADEGKYLTQASESVEKRTYSRVVWLTKSDSPENYREATAEEKQAYENNINN